MKIDLRQTAVLIYDISGLRGRPLDPGALAPRKAKPLALLEMTSQGDMARQNAYTFNVAAIAHGYPYWAQVHFPGSEIPDGLGDFDVDLAILDNLDGSNKKKIMRGKIKVTREGMRRMKAKYSNDQIDTILNMGPDLAESMTRFDAMLEARTKKPVVVTDW